MTTRTTKLLQQWPKPLHLQIQIWSNLTHAHAIIKRPVSVSCADMKPIQWAAFCSITGWSTALCRLVKHYANCTTTIKLRKVSLLCANVLEVQYNQVLWYYWHVRQQNLWNARHFTERTIKLRSLNYTMDVYRKSLSSPFLEFIYWSVIHDELGWNYHWQENSCKYITNFERILYLQECNFL